VVSPDRGAGRPEQLSPGLPAQAPLAEAGAIPERATGPWRDRLGALLSQRSAQVGLVILGVLVFCAIFADVIAPYGPRDQLTGAGEPGRRAQPCIHLLGCPADQPETWLGTDGNSRDVFSRTIHGARISLWVGLATVGIAILVGGSIGAVAGFAGGMADNGLMRIMDVLLAFPALLLAIAIVTVLGTGLLNAQMAVAIVAIPIYARVMRSAVLSVKEMDFVTASRALGESSTGTLARRVLPNSLTPVVVAGTLGIATAVLEVAALSFLGLGAPPTEPEWGNMIGREFNGIFTRPLIVLAPGVALTMTVLAFNLVGDGLRDALDPRLNR
jgi:ABC-type dipeptide/oligopeptide/nickel transport system permease subunit